jgi:hypothetical protein
MVSGFGFQVSAVGSKAQGPIYKAQSCMLKVQSKKMKLLPFNLLPGKDPNAQVQIYGDP